MFENINFTFDVEHITSLLNIVLGLLVFIFWFRVHRINSSSSTAWLSIGTALIGLYWIGIYVFLLIAPFDSFDRPLFARTFVRLGVSFSLTLTASLGIVWYKRLKLWTG